jgi:hypothetical protein
MLLQNAFYYRNQRIIGKWQYLRTFGNGADNNIELTSHFFFFCKSGIKELHQACKGSYYAASED